MGAWCLWESPRPSEADADPFKLTYRLEAGRCSISKLVRCDVILSAAIAGRGTLRRADAVDAVEGNVCASCITGTPRISRTDVLGFVGSLRSAWRAPAG